MADEDQKPETAGKLSLKVRVSEDDFMDFKIKSTTKFAKVFAAIASQRGLQESDFTLDYDGERINAKNTPEELGMQEEEVVDFRMAQIGGASSLHKQR